jgi:hypothetical protein
VVNDRAQREYAATMEGRVPVHQHEATVRAWETLEKPIRHPYRKRDLVDAEIGSRNDDRARRSR